MSPRYDSPEGQAVLGTSSSTVDEGRLDDEETSDGHRSRDFVQLLERGLAIIRVFNSERPSLTVSEIAREGLKFYEAGMDLGLSDDPEESFRLFQGKIIDEYEKMIPEFGLTVVDATLSVEVQQAQVRQIVQADLESAKNLRIRP